MRCLQSSGHNSRIIAPPFRTTRMQLWSSSRHPPSRMRRSLHASQVLKEKENTPLSPSEANSQSDMVKEAWEELNNNTMTLGSVLGKDNISRLETQLGKAKVDQIAGFVDPVLRNRRALTLASAILDVALVLGGITFLRNVTAGGN